MLVGGGGAGALVGGVSGWAGGGKVEALQRDVGVPGSVSAWATSPGMCSTPCLKTTHVCDRAWPGPLDRKPSPFLQAADALQPTLQPEMQLEHGAIQIQ